MELMHLLFGIEKLKIFRINENTQINLILIFFQVIYYTTGEDNLMNDGWAMLEY